MEKVEKEHNQNVDEINAWYNEEYDKAYREMTEAKNKYEELGGYATSSDSVQLNKQLLSVKEKYASSGMTGSGAEKNETEILQKQIENTNKRVYYSEIYDDKYKYINETLPVQKNDKLLKEMEEYNKNLNQISI